MIDKASPTGRATHEPSPGGLGLPVGIPDADDPVVGHMTLSDGSRIPLRKREAEEIWAGVERDTERRRTAMPDEASAIRQLFDAQLRLKELGWQDPIYAPKDGSPLDIIELGSTGIHRGCYEGQWPTGGWWIFDGDIWSSRPALARPAKAMEARQGRDEGSVHDSAAREGSPEGDSHD